MDNKLVRYNAEIGKSKMLDAVKKGQLEFDKYGRFQFSIPDLNTVLIDVLGGSSAY